MIESLSVNLDAAFKRAELADAEAFGVWAGMVENPLRKHLARFARYVDVEAVLQETLLRMWLFVCDSSRRLEGENASLKFAYGVARNVAREEARCNGLGKFVDEKDLDHIPEPGFEPELPDPALRKAILLCIGRLPAQPKAALRARIQHEDMPDRELAEMQRMKLNTFLQNIVRARKFMAECLESRGVRLGGISS